MSPSIDALHAAGLEVPRIGLGTFRLESESVTRVVEAALGVGYRHIDTAERYGNEREVGLGVRNSRVPREHIFIATKIAHTEAAASDAPAAARGCVERLGTGYVDLLYLHWPHPDIPPEETFESLLPLVDEGIIRGLGVSNFPSELVRRVLRVTPLVANEVEHHPYLPQPTLERVAEESGSCLTSYAPFAEGRVFDDPVLQAIGAKHSKTAGQITLRWLLDKPCTVVIPKTSSVERLGPNMDIAGIELDDDDRRRIAALGTPSTRYFDPPWGPKWDES